MLARLNAQSEVQPTQVPIPSPAEVPNFSVPPLPVNIDISHQKAEINSLTQVTQQWSTPVQPNPNTLHSG